MYDVSFVIEIRIPFQYLPYTNPTSNIYYISALIMMKPMSYS